MNLSPHSNFINGKQLNSIFIYSYSQAANSQHCCLLLKRRGQVRSLQRIFFKWSSCLKDSENLKINLINTKGTWICKVCVAEYVLPLSSSARFSICSKCFVLLIKKVRQTGKRRQPALNFRRYSVRIAPM